MEPEAGGVIRFHGEGSDDKFYRPPRQLPARGGRQGLGQADHDLRVLGGEGEGPLQGGGTLGGLLQGDVGPPQHQPALKLVGVLLHLGGQALDQDLQGGGVGAPGRAVSGRRRVGPVGGGKFQAGDDGAIADGEIEPGGEGGQGQGQHQGGHRGPFPRAGGTGTLAIDVMEQFTFQITPGGLVLTAVQIAGLQVSIQLLQLLTKDRQVELVLVWRLLRLVAGKKGRDDKEQGQGGEPGDKDPEDGHALSFMGVESSASRARSRCCSSAESSCSRASRFLRRVRKRKRPPTPARSRGPNQRG